MAYISKDDKVLKEGWLKKSNYKGLLNTNHPKWLFLSFPPPVAAPLPKLTSPCFVFGWFFCLGHLTKAASRRYCVLTDRYFDWYIAPVRLSRVFFCENLDPPLGYGSPLLFPPGPELPCNNISFECVFSKFLLVSRL